MKSTITIHTAAVNNGHFNCRPAMAHELEPDKILANEVTLPWEGHYHGNQAWVIGNEFGAICLIWANNEQEALDEACDQGLMESFLSEEQDHENEELTGLGNASELHDLTYCWLLPVAWDVARDVEILCKLAECRGGGYDHLGKL